MKMLICSDGHLQAELAVRFISATAARCKAEVTLLGIIEHPSEEAALGEALRRSAAILRELGVTTATLTRSGFPIEQIQKQTREESYDLVVIGAERKQDGPFALSTKVYHLIKELEPPVLVMIGQQTEIKKALICSGGRPDIEKAVKLTGQLLCKSAAEVTILHVLAEAPLIFADLLEDEAAAKKLLASNSALARHLRGLLDPLTKLGIKGRLKLRHGLVGSEVVSEAGTGGYDIVVAGSAPSQGALRTYILGDVTSEIVNSVECAVLVVRGEGAKNGGWRSRLLGLFHRKAGS